MDKNGAYLWKETVNLCKIADYYFYGSRKVGSVFHSEGEPLQASGTVGVWTYEYMIFILADSRYMIAISAFEVGIELHIILILMRIGVYPFFEGLN